MHKPIGYAYAPTKGGEKYLWESGRPNKHLLSTTTPTAENIDNLSTDSEDDNDYLDGILFAQHGVNAQQ